MTSKEVIELFNGLLKSKDALRRSGLNGNEYNLSVSNGFFEALEVVIKALEQEPTSNVLDKIKAEIEEVKAIMNEEIIKNNRKDLINFVNGLNQSLIIIDKYKLGGSNVTENTNNGKSSMPIL